MPFNIIISETHVSGLSARTVLEIFKKQNLKNVVLCIELTKTDFPEIKEYFKNKINITKNLEKLAIQKNDYDQISAQVTKHLNTSTPDDVILHT